MFQTGSGKTHTMLGDIDELAYQPSEERGMTPRIFEYLFARIKQVSIKIVQEFNFLESSRKFLLYIGVFKDLDLCYYAHKITEEYLVNQEEENREQEQLRYICKCSFLEIYNEHIADLLDPTSTNLQVLHTPFPIPFLDETGPYDRTLLQSYMKITNIFSWLTDTRRCKNWSIC